ASAALRTNLLGTCGRGAKRLRREEWQYALQYRCPDSKCEGFIRPVYWQKPMPDPPPELSHVNFKYVPLADRIKVEHD
ncbi:hypothetical protein, partial [Candidatus Accumulibacter aalborgensis]|uniref:hypothetical protein n=1 Tax=Candidatus Accumulibacter aalborgensis TaxID=1860102 RepID=UPI001C924260